MTRPRATTGAAYTVPSKADDVHTDRVAAGAAGPSGAKPLWAGSPWYIGHDAVAVATSVVLGAELVVGAGLVVVAVGLDLGSEVLQPASTAPASTKTATARKFGLICRKCMSFLRSTRLQGSIHHGVRSPSDPTGGLRRNGLVRRRCFPSTHC